MKRHERQGIEPIAYGPQDLAKLLGVGTKKAYEIAAEIGVRHGKRYIVSRARLEEWLAAGER